MTTQAFVGNWYFERGDGGSPEVFTRVCEVYAMSGLGQLNDLIEATTTCSGGVKEYIGGLADGQEFTVDANYVAEDAQLAAMIADVSAKVTRNLQVIIDNGSPEQTISFAAVALGWVLNPSVDDRNTITFTFKVSGDITIA